jgi:hypothetical protein
VEGAEKVDYDTVLEFVCEAKRKGRFVNLSAARWGARR